ncbi:hypothetical protein ILUMI_04370, partial [Ignelater luminosus]
ECLVKSAIPNIKGNLEDHSRNGMEAGLAEKLPLRITLGSIKKPEKSSNYRALDKIPNTREIFKEITGGSSKHEELNNNGLRLIELAIERNMKIMNTRFQREDIHKETSQEETQQTRSTMY